MHLNGVPTNMHSAQQVAASRETEVFQTPPTTPRYKEAVEEDGGVIYLNCILPIDPTYQDSPDTLPGGKPKSPHDFDQETLEDETPLNQWLDGSSRRSHQHWNKHLQRLLPLRSRRGCSSTLSSTLQRSKSHSIAFCEKCLLLQCNFKLKTLKTPFFLKIKSLKTHF